MFRPASIFWDIGASGARNKHAEPLQFCVDLRFLF